MNAEITPTGFHAPPPLEKWSRSKWLALIALVFAAHVILIFIFGAKSEIVPRAVKNIPQLQLADDKNELLALNDPTLFVLPSEDDFSPAGALQMVGVKSPPLWMPSPDGTLALTFAGAMEEEKISLSEFDFKPQPKFSAPDLEITPAFAQNSTAQIVGELARRKLLAPLNLPSWPDNDVLQPTVAQVLVDADGNVISSVILQTSGLSDADERALKISRDAHFVPAENVSVGRIIFNWRTIAPASSNSP